jgi:hypothetical protein
LPQKREPGGDLVTSGTPSQPDKVDDKAARLEQHIERLEKRSSNEKFLAFSVSVVVFLSFISVYIPSYAFAGVFLISLILLIAMAYHWDFPQVVQPLNDLFYGYMSKRKATPKSPDETDETENND